MATVTVLGASGTITVPFDSPQNAKFAQTLAYYISQQITAGQIFKAPYNANPPPSPSGGASLGEYVLGANSPATAPSSVNLPAAYPVLVNNASNPVTISAAANPVAAFSVIGGTGGTTFFSGNSTVGGAIFFGGGVNTLAGAASATSVGGSTNGGLAGNWTIGSGEASGAESTSVYLASGNDFITSGFGDSIYGGGATVTAIASGTDTGAGGNAPTLFLGDGVYTVVGTNKTFFNVKSAAASDITAGGTAGGGQFFGGLGGANSIQAGIGNSTLVSGGGGSDTLSANTTSGAQGILFGKGTGDVLYASSTEGASGGSTLYGGAGANEALYGGAGKDALAVGTGSGDTLYAGTGNDSFWFDQPLTNGTNQTDIISGYTSVDSLILDGYGGASGYTTVATAASASLSIKLSDGTQINFVNSPGVTSLTNLKITSIS